MKYFFTLIYFFSTCCVFGSLSFAKSLTCRNLFVETDEIAQSIRALAELRIRLDLAKSENQLSIAYFALDSEFHRKKQKLLKYGVENSLFNKTELLASIRTEVELLQSETKDESQERKFTTEELIQFIKVDGSQAVFHRVKPVARMNFKLKQFSFDISQEEPFELMATPVTQAVWREIVVLAKEKFPNRYNHLKESPSHFTGDLNPVENVSKNEINLWLSALNSLSQNAEPHLHHLIVDHNDGDKYDLPSKQQWLIVAFENQPLVDIRSDQPADTKEIAWYQPQSVGRTQPVATKSPTNIGPAKFYDMFGNVRQWLRTFRIASNSDHEFLVSGFDYTSSKPALFDNTIEAKSAITKDSTIGFRLVREVKNP